jgi:hypothetical protein
LEVSHLIMLCFGAGEVDQLVIVQSLFATVRALVMSILLRTMTDCVSLCSLHQGRGVIREYIRP